MYRALFAIALANASGVTMAATQPQVVHVTSSAPDVVFQLAANATTGFRWFLSKKPDWMQSVSSHYLPSKSNRVGAGGVSEWHFRWPANKCVVPTQASIEMLYARSWMPVSDSVKRQSITVYCKPSS